MNAFEASELFGSIEESSGKENNSLYLTGKFARIFKAKLSKGKVIRPEAALWAYCIRKKRKNRSVCAVDLSASGYVIVGLGKDEVNANGTIISNPACGTGCGMNLKRIILKLGIPPEKVDAELTTYLGDDNIVKRKEIPVRTDRCGVFSSSAVISDRNQGLPIDFAFATLFSRNPRGELPFDIGTSSVYLEKGTDLLINAQLAECIVSSLTQSFYYSILSSLNIKSKRIESLSSHCGEVDKDKLEIYLIKTQGPINYYSSQR